MPYSDQALKIAVVGGGPGGLALARILYIHGMRSVVFERESFFSERPQGGTLDMHAETGQFAFRKADLEAEFKRSARYEDQGVRIADKQGRILFEDSTNDGDRPELDRACIRQIFLDSLPSDTVRWGHNLRAVQPHRDGTWQLIFSGHSAPERFDLVVGADGTWSKVRPLVSPIRPEYEGILFVEFHLSDIDTKHPNLAQLLGHGKLFALGDSKGILAQRNAGGHVYGYAAFHASETWPGELAHPQIREHLFEEFAGWSEELLAFFHAADNNFIPRPLCFLPPGHNWPNRAGITILGDAAHVMSPFSGEGANLAMRDGADLALALIEQTDWRTAVIEFEQMMCKRAALSARAALEAIREVFSKNGVEHAIEQMKSHQAESP